MILLVRGSLLLPVNMTMETNPTIKRKRKSPEGKPAEKLASGAIALREEVTQVTVKGKVGQPTKFTQELWQDIMDRIACYENIIDICARPDMPSHYTIRKWYRTNPELKDQIREAWADASFLGNAVNENILRGGVLSTGDFRRDEALVQNNRWFMGKTNRRDFGDKVQLDVVSHQVFVLPNDAIEGEGY